MDTLHIKLKVKGFKRVPHHMKSEKIWVKDKVCVQWVRRRIPRVGEAVRIQGSKNSDGIYDLPKDEDKLKEALKKL